VNTSILRQFTSLEVVLHYSFPVTWLIYLVISGVSTLEIVTYFVGINALEEIFKITI